MKQVIVMRKDLNMRKGKMVAQGGHAVLGAWKHAQSMVMGSSDAVALWSWFNQLQTKICVGVESEAELLELHSAAERAMLPAYLVRDAGLTEFKEPTLTCLAIGPAPAEEIDKITGHLKLL